MTDRNRLAVAPALGERARKAQQIAGKTIAHLTAQQADAASAGKASSAFAPAQSDSSSSSSSISQNSAPAEPEGDYLSPVSGRIVLGAPVQRQPAIVNDPHAMAPLPGQAPEQPIAIVFDGGSRGNPGRGYGSYALRWPGEEERKVRLQFGNDVTNNEAEYDTLISSVEAVRKRLRDGGVDLNSARLDIRGDSQLVINQVNGEWQTKNPRMAQRCTKAQELLAGFGQWQLRYHPRAKSVEVLGH